MLPRLYLLLPIWLRPPFHLARAAASPFVRGLLLQCRRAFGTAVALRIVDEMYSLHAQRALVGPPGRWDRSLARLELPGYPHPVWYRRNTTDIHTLHQVLVSEEYGPALEDLAPDAAILDCGANIGLSSLYFLTRLPRSRVVAVEPDDGNAELCRRNLAPFGARAEVVQAAVWGRPASLRLDPGPGAPGAEDARQVHEPFPGEGGDVAGITVSELLDRHHLARVGLLKMDVEGAEKDVFARDTGWLDRIDNIAIELHGDDGADAFRRAMAGWSRREIVSGEILICLGLRRGGSR